MKYINKLIIVLGALFLVKRLFFNEKFQLGIIDKHYGIVAIILLILLIVSEIFLKKHANK
jgi:uncharacterized membrane protein